MAALANLTQIRCPKVLSVKNGRPFICRRLLVCVESGKGESQCPRCGHKMKWEVEQG